MFKIIENICIHICKYMYINIYIIKPVVVQNEISIHLTKDVSFWECCKVSMLQAEQWHIQYLTGHCHWQYIKLSNFNKWDDINRQWLACVIPNIVIAVHKQHFICIYYPCRSTRTSLLQLAVTFHSLYSNTVFSTTTFFHITF